MGLGVVCARRNAEIKIPAQKDSYNVDFNPKIKIELALAADQVEKVVEAIRTAANSEKIGDGKIFVLPIEDVMRVRTGERGEDAI